MVDEISIVRHLLAMMRNRQGKPFIAKLMNLDIEAMYTYILEPGDSAIDVGANRGRHTFPMARAVGMTGRVYAVEAATETLATLKAALQNTRVPGARQITTVLPVAVSDESGTAEFVYLPHAGARSGLGSSDIKDDEARTETVQVERLDNIIPVDDKKVKFIKIDIEGAELPALRGATGILDRCRPAIAFENGRHRERFNYTIADVCNFFEEREYLLYTPFGTKYGQKWEDGNSPGQLFAIPAERSDATENLVVLCLLEAMIKAVPAGEARLAQIAARGTSAPVE